MKLSKKKPRKASVRIYTNLRGRLIINFSKRVRKLLAYDDGLIFRTIRFPKSIKFAWLTIWLAEKIKDFFAYVRFDSCGA
ncbi:hypothetical protein DSCA_18800 [Desulfosarcina alkanivorans]|uniref:Uncharacterized protein n=1 Tax=Desulfosarcina alkanivorans TaxID=571177 RepID=A0A5K7YIN0_9BACT|nr:hypothetical protein [Desulfosarcina alkanivorans]BBO67950.1 hypothetical protein DSCA_18800 [Desulfosarcina alkanivorans]